MKLGTIASSSDPSNVSLTFLGFSLEGVIQVVALFGKFLLPDLAEAEVSLVVMNLAHGVSALLIAWGGTRKIVKRVMTKTG